MVEDEAKFETLLVKKEDGVATVVLNRPEMRNAMNLTMADEMPKVMAQLEIDDQVRAILLTGSGRDFCSGADLAQGDAKVAMSSTIVRDIIRRFNVMMLSILGVEKPVVCAVNGAAVGGGLALLLACDVTIASDAAKFRAVYFHRGIVSDGGITFLLPRAVGLPKAKELIFGGDTIDAREAERIGLINKVVPADRLNEDAMTFAKRLASGPTKAIGLSKAIIHRNLGMDIISAFEWEAWGQQLCYHTEDFGEGISAFLTKRAPNFKGR
jgi:2-(1,2-epoxy-1,2-dihydrophenyl)acetyl-CoA isomerase